MQPLNPPMANLRRITQHMFESVGVLALYIANPAVLALRATGRNTGVVCHLGEGGL